MLAAMVRSAAVLLALAPPLAGLWVPPGISAAASLYPGPGWRLHLPLPQAVPTVLRASTAPQRRRLWDWGQKAPAEAAAKTRCFPQ